MSGKYAKRHGPLNVLGFDDSMRRDFYSGLITLEEAAWEYYKANHTHCVDLEYTKRKLGIIEQQPADELEAINLVEKLGYDEALSRLDNLFREAKEK